MEWQFKQGLQTISIVDFWHDLTEENTIDPHKILEKKFQVKKLIEAIDLVQSFQRALEELGLLDEGC